MDALQKATDDDEMVFGPKKVRMGASGYIEKELEVEKLKEYIKISPKYWTIIEHKKHIRYRTKDDKLHIGAIVINSNFMKHDDEIGELVPCFLLGYWQNDRRMTSKRWEVPHHMCKDVYEHGTALTLSVRDSNKELFNTIADNIRKLDTKINILAEKLRK